MSNHRGSVCARCILAMSRTRARGAAALCFIRLARSRFRGCIDNNISLFSGWWSAGSGSDLFPTLGRSTAYRSPPWGRLSNGRSGDRCSSSRAGPFPWWSGWQR